MVAAGVTEERGDHARVIATVALEMLSSLQAVSNRHGRRLSFRFGTNSGPLVAGVIGTAKLQYDPWGDTVNTAARMEAHGVSGRIHISEASYRLLRDDFECEQGYPADQGQGRHDDLVPDRSSRWRGAA